MRKTATFLFAFIVHFGLYSQGCSDAGVCSIGGLKENHTTLERSRLTFNSQFGIGEQGVKIFISQIEFQTRLDSFMSVQIKLPYVFASGNLGNTNGPGDIILALSRGIYKNNSIKLGVNLGFRIGVNNANKRKTNTMLANTTSILPMPYQTSLGTHDLLLGIDGRIKDKWLIAAAIQLPVIQFNRNEFDTSGVFDSETEKKKYFSSRHLIRRPDLVLRIDRNFNLHKQLIVSAGLLPIYHLGNDSGLDPEIRKPIQNSSGLTLNISSSITFKASKNFSIIGRYASPLIVRKVRPDGLTRHFVTALELHYSF